MSAALRLGMYPEEAERVADDALARQEWRRRHGRKECSSCHADKPVSEFRRNSSRRDGLHHACRKCEAMRNV